MEQSSWTLQPKQPGMDNSSTSSSMMMYTEWEPLQLRQEWTICNFAKALELATFGTCMRSQTFKDDSMPEISWQLCLYPGGKREENKDHVSLFLKMSAAHTTREFTVRAEYRFYFVGDDGVARFSNVNTGDFKVKPMKGSHSWGLRNIPRQKVMNCIRQDQSLLIVCQIELVPDFNKMTTNVRRSKRFEPELLTKVYIGNIHRMLETGEGSDFVIECSDQKFHVHRFMLMAQSEVFRAMFSHKTTIENVESRIRLEDTNPTAVSHMLTYIYSGALPDGFVDENAPGLMEISEKYALDQLKVLLQEKLISRLIRGAGCSSPALNDGFRLTPGNVVSMLALADVYNADLLMTACIPLVSHSTHPYTTNSWHWQHLKVRSNIRAILGSADWSDIKENNPKLANDVLEKVVTIDDSPPPKRSRIQDVFYRAPQ